MTNTASKGGNKKRKPTLIDQAQCLRPYEEIFAFLPCNNKKYPPIKGWQNKSFSIDEIGGFNFVAAIGVRTKVGQTELTLILLFAKSIAIPLVRPSIPNFVIL